MQLIKTQMLVLRFLCASALMMLCIMELLLVGAQVLLTSLKVEAQLQLMGTPFVLQLRWLSNY